MLTTCAVLRGQEAQRAKPIPAAEPVRGEPDSKGVVAQLVVPAGRYCTVRFLSSLEGAFEYGISLRPPVPRWHALRQESGVPRPARHGSRPSALSAQSSQI